MINNLMENKNNIIRFPIERRMDLRLDEPSEELENMCDSYAANFLNDLYYEGYDISDEKYIYDVSLMFESIRSLIFRFNSLDHPMQDFSKSLYSSAEKRIEQNQKQLEFDF